MVVLPWALAVLFLIAVAGWSRTHMRLQAAHSALFLAHRREDLQAARARSAELLGLDYRRKYLTAATDADEWFEQYAYAMQRLEAAEHKVSRMTSRTKGARGRFVAAD